MNTSTTHWVSSSDALTKVDALCLGTGRFLRSVLVPSMINSGYTPALIQPRGRSFLEYMSARQRKSGEATYEVDTVMPDGTVETNKFPCAAAFSLGREEDKHALVEALAQMKEITFLGVGVTEAGMANKDTEVMRHLYDLLHLISLVQKDRGWDASKLCVVDMDNVPNNGTVLQSYMEQHAGDDTSMKAFLSDQVVFVNTMVDRITSQRPGSNGMVPRCEPTPAKALVMCDPSGAVLPSLANQPGVVIRSSMEQLQVDIALKLRIANGTHTAIAQTLALLQQLQTDVLSRYQDDADQAKWYMQYLDTLVDQQIIPACGTDGKDSMCTEAALVWNDWRQRLVHAHFGLSSFFITQNGTAKGGIRFGPTVIDLVNKAVPLQVSWAFAYAALLRWLTPLPGTIYKAHSKQQQVGWLEDTDPSTLVERNEATSTEYANGLRYHLEEGWYEFACPLPDLTTLLQGCHGNQPSSCVEAVRYYLEHPQGGDLKSISSTLAFRELLRGTAVLYARLVAGDGLLGILQEFGEKKHGVELSSPCRSLAELEQGGSSLSTRPLYFQPQSLPDSSRLMKVPLDITTVGHVVTSEVQGVVAIDLHTHILPPSHGALCLWGIDELLTYHYLVAEYFMTARKDVTPESFFAMSKQEQADLVWQALFLDRSPISEACRGVLTTLRQLGCDEELKNRDLGAIRAFYQHSYGDRENSNGAERFCNDVFANAGIEYAVMTNIPFDSNEAQYWKPQRAAYSSHFRSALRVDPLLAGDMATIEATLKSSGYEVSLEGARQYLRDWCDTMHPEYMMASTPHDFVIPNSPLDGVAKTGLNLEAMKQPGAFAGAIGTSDGQQSCDGGAQEDTPSVIDEHSDLLNEVLMRVCEERDLPVALKIGAHRGVNPALEAAGDGVVAFADAGVLARLCLRFPKVRFLATFLSRNNQHEACVLATKFRNLHIYGCWWFCNNPSLIREITSMRVEMLGTAFTAQHSDARVVDQLLYKWPHSRAVIAEVLIQEYTKSIESGWRLTRGEVRRDIERLFRGSYEEFMAKTLK